MGGFTFETVFAFLAKCGWETGSGAGRGEIKYFDGVFKSAVYSGGGMRWDEVKRTKVLLCGGVECGGVGCYLTFTVVDYSVGRVELWVR